MHTKVLIFPRLSVSLSPKPVTEAYSDAIDILFLHIKRILKADLYAETSPEGDCDKLGSNRRLNLSY